MRKIIAAVAATGFAALTMSVAAPANANPSAPQSKAIAATTVRNELFACGDQGIANGIHTWHCTGPWYGGSPGVRTVYINVSEFRETASSWASQSFHSVQSTDNTRKVYKWYCRYANGTTTGLLATTTVGAGLPSSYSWSPDYTPCAGSNMGTVADVFSTYLGLQYETKVDVQGPAAGDGYWYGHPETTY